MVVSILSNSSTYPLIRTPRHDSIVKLPVHHPLSPLSHTTPAVVTTTNKHRALPSMLDPPSSRLVQHDRDHLHKSTRIKSNSHISESPRRLLHLVSRVTIALLPSTQPTCALRSLPLHASPFAFVYTNIHRIHHRHVSTRHSAAEYHVSLTSLLPISPSHP